MDFITGDLVECAMYGTGVIEHISTGSTPILVRFDSGVTMLYDFEGACIEHHAKPTLGFRGTAALIVNERPNDVECGQIWESINSETDYKFILVVGVGRNDVCWVKLTNHAGLEDKCIYSTDIDVFTYRYKPYSKSLEHFAPPC